MRDMAEKAVAASRAPYNAMYTANVERLVRRGATVHNAFEMMSRN